MKQHILSIALTLCLCISSHSLAYACQESILLQEDILTGESASEQVTYDNTVPTPAEAYEAMAALKGLDAYKEGITWTDNEPYSDMAGYYHWKGGTLDGKNISAVGCVAFAFILSDAAFGSLPARMYSAGGFSFSDIKAGDILRMNNDTHTVIVLEASDVGVVIAEGNYSGKIHWGRAISKEEVMRDTDHYITRYPEGYIAPDDPAADESICNGTLDGGLIWDLTKAGTLTVSGNGPMPDFSSWEEQPWSDNSSLIRKVIIEDGITAIGSCSFWNCGILSAEIPPTVSIIGNNAFRNSSVISISIPSGVETIGDSAFRECQNLSLVTFSEGLETISQNAFRACTSLASIDLPASIVEVGAASFFQCTAMTSATFAPGSNQVTLGDNIFTQCYYLMHVTLPSHIDCIGEGMFQNCMMLAGIEIPQGTQSIGASAFASCSNLSVVIIPDSITTIGIAAFASSSLADIYFTGSETQWNSITKIGDTASALSKAALHCDYVFPSSPDADDSDNSGLNNGNDSDENINDNNSECNDAPDEDNNSNGNNEDNSNKGNNTSGNSGDASDAHSGNGNSKAPVQAPFPKGKTFTIGKFTYKVTKAGKEVKLTASKSTAKKVTINTVTGTDGVTYKVTSISAKAMQNNKKVKSLTIGANVKTIGTKAFSGCTKLTTVVLGKNVSTLGANTFKGCGKLAKIKIKSAKLNSVGKNAFKTTKPNLKVKVPSKQLAKYRKLLKKTGLKTKQVTV